MAGACRPRGVQGRVHGGGGGGAFARGSARAGVAGAGGEHVVVCKGAGVQLARGVFGCEHAGVHAATRCGGARKRPQHTRSRRAVYCPRSRTARRARREGVNKAEGSNLKLREGWGQPGLTPLMLHHGGGPGGLPPGTGPAGVLLLVAGVAAPRGQAAEAAPRCPGVVSQQGRHAGEL